jgi:hypothetical protein
VLGRDVASWTYYLKTGYTDYVQKVKHGFERQPIDKRLLDELWTRLDETRRVLYVSRQLGRAPAYELKVSSIEFAKIIDQRVHSSELASHRTLFGQVLLEISRLLPADSRNEAKAVYEYSRSCLGPDNEITLSALIPQVRDPTRIVQWFASEVLRVMACIAVADRKLREPEVAVIASAMKAIGTALAEEDLVRLIVAECKDIAKRGPTDVMREACERLQSLRGLPPAAFVVECAESVSVCETEINEVAFSLLSMLKKATGEHSGNCA